MRTRCATAGGKSRLIAAFGFAAATCLLLASLPSQVEAQQPSAGLRETPSDTFTFGGSHSGFSVVEPPAGVLQRKRDAGDDGSGRWFFQGWEKAPETDTSSENVYNDALKALDAGRTAEAQQLFERVIAKDPGSVRAGEARLHLGRIYRAGEAEYADPSAMRTSSDDALSGLTRAALQNAPVSPTIDGLFLADAGDRVFFSPGSAVLGTRARGVIQAQARFLVQRPYLSAAVEGHADDGSVSDVDALRLSQERALVVRDRLIAEGVAAERIAAYGRGREVRIANCPASDCLAQNRRVVTILVDGPLRFDLTSTRSAQGGVQDVPNVAPTQ